MKLAEAIERLGEFDRGHTIYAAKPWEATSKAIVAPEPPPGGLPAEASEAKLEYFLEVNVAREVVEDWIGAEQDPSARAICQRLIQYATNDA